MNTLLNDYNIEYRELISLRRSAIEKRQTEEGHYRHELKNLPKYEYQLESAKTMLRKIKAELEWLNKFPVEQLTNEQKIRKSQLEKFRYSALSELREGKTYYRMAHRNIKLYKPRFHSARNEEAVMIQINSWVYQQTAKYVKESGIIDEKFLKQPLAVRQSKLMIMQWESPVHLKVYEGEGCDTKIYEVEVYGTTKTFFANVKYY